MEAEIQALSLGLDYKFLIKDLIEEIIGRTLQLEAMIESNIIFNVVSKDGQTAERRLKIDIIAHIQSYHLGELDGISSLQGTENHADSRTKPTVTTNSPMFRIMNSRSVESNRRFDCPEMLCERQQTGSLVV